MSRRGCWYAIFAVVVGLTLCSGVAAAEPLVDLDPETDLAGNGTESDPYQIGNSSELQAITGNLSANYTLTSSIDASNTSAWNGGAGFEPIGNSTDPFTGSFDGREQTISGLYINQTTDDAVGLFGSADGAEIERVGLDSVSIVGNASVGADIFVGGLVGNMSGTVSNSSVTGTVDGSDTAGGLVGHLRGTVTNSYANSSVDGGSFVGGLVGQTATTGEIRTSYAVGRVDESGLATDAGGLVGTNGGNVVDSYWDTESTGQATSYGGTGLTTAQLTGNNATVDGTMDGFAFYDHWIPTESYPALTWQFVAESTGDGTEQNPYHIEDSYGLQAITVDLAANYTLSESVDLSETAEWNDGAGFEPIANNSDFSGSFDGDNHTISDLTINRSTASNVGLFGSIGSTGTISNVTLTDATVSGNRDVGTLAGANQGSISDVQVSTVVQGNRSPGEGNASSIGGFVGENAGNITQSTVDGNVSADDGGGSIGGFVGVLSSGGQIADSHATGTVSVTDGGSVGGLVGSASGDQDSDEISNSTANVSIDAVRSDNVGGLLGSGSAFAVITDSSARGTVSGEMNVGGLVGKTESDIFRSFATGDVIGNDTSGQNIGGLVGSTNGPTRNSSAHGNVTGHEYVGGLAGEITDTASTVAMSTSFSVGDVDGNATNGSFAGRVATGVTVDDSYFDSSTSGVSAAVGDGPDDGITGLTTSQLQGSAATENTNLSFNPVWIATDGYPLHVWRVDDYTLSLSGTDIDTDDTAMSTVTLSLSDDSTQNGHRASGVFEQR